MRNPMWENIFRKPADDSETVLALRGVPIFQDLNKKQLREIEHLVHHRTYVLGEKVFSQGQPGLGLYIILRGTIDIVRTDLDGNDLKLASLEEGAFFGEMGLLVDTPRSANAIASEVSEVVAFFRPDLMDLINRRPALGIRILHGVAQVMAKRLQEQNRVSQELQGQISDLQKQIKAAQERSAAGTDAARQENGA